MLFKKVPSLFDITRPFHSLLICSSQGNRRNLVFARDTDAIYRYKGVKGKKNVMTVALQTTAHMETRALRRNSAWAPWEAACCSCRFGFSLILPLLLTLSPLNQTPVHSIIVLRGEARFPPNPQGKDGGEGTGMR